MKTPNIFDIHSHILFGIDDGATDIEMSVAMIKSAYDHGVRNIICTSHDGFKQREYCRNFELLTDRIKQERIGVNIYKGSEIYCEAYTVNNIIRSINTDKATTLNGTEYVLLEFYPDAPGDEILMCVNAVKKNTDKKIVIAHIERCCMLEHDSETLVELKKMGCLFQINAFSLVKEKDEEIKLFARRLLSEKAVDFIGSDAHRTYHRPPDVLSGVEYIYDYCEEEYADAVCFGNAEKLFLK